MHRIFAVALMLVAASCTHEEGAHVAYPTTQVTVQQTTVVQQTVPVHVHQHRPIDCDMMCRTVDRSCRQACRPTSWSPNMRSIQDSCEGDCRFSRFVCVGDCVRSGGFSRTRRR
jgi:hypothetical protein